MAYATKTKVPAERTRAQIETLLGKHGVTRKGVMTDDASGTAYVAFTIHDINYQIEVPLCRFIPVRGIARDTEASKKQREQANRERWRLVLLALKAKLELVALGASTIKREFLADRVLPDGRPLHRAVEDALTRGVNFVPLLPVGDP